MAQQLVAVLGPSGSGKSSAVRAGLVPAIGTRALPGSSAWPPPVVMTPGRRPLEQLAIRLGSRRAAHDGTAVYRSLLADPQSMRIVAGEMLDEGAELVVVVDQFEEVFTLCDDEAERAAFVACIVHAVVEQSRVRVVLALRADYLGACTAYPGLVGRLQDTQVLVGPMSEAELAEAIVRPAELVGVPVEARLVDVIVHDVRGEPGALPLVSHALAAAWALRTGPQLTVADYLGAGGVRGAIAKTADDVVAAMPPEEQAWSGR